MEIVAAGYKVYAEIKKALPQESEYFSQVDRYFRTLMGPQKLGKNSNCKKFLNTNLKIVDELKYQNSQLDYI